MLSILQASKSNCFLGRPLLLAHLGMEVRCQEVQEPLKWEILQLMTDTNPSGSTRTCRVRRGASSGEESDPMTFLMAQLKAGLLGRPSIGVFLTPGLSASSSPGHTQ